MPHPKVVKFNSYRPKKLYSVSIFFFFKRVKSVEMAPLKRFCDKIFMSFYQFSFLLNYLSDNIFLSQVRGIFKTNISVLVTLFYDKSRNSNINKNK